MLSNIFNTTMRHGLILGALFSLNFIMSVSNNLLLGFLTYVIAGVIVYYAYKFTITYRDRQLGGVISFSHAYLFVLLLFFFGTIISSFVKYFYLQYLNPEFIELHRNMLLESIEMYKQFMPSIPEDTLYDSVEIIASPKGYTMMSAWSNIFLSLIVGLIIALIVKKSASPFDKQ